MISKEEIKKLADLARIHVEEEEVENLRNEMGVILDYVGQVKSVSGELADQVEVGTVRNVMREDENPNESGVYTDDVLREAPDKENGYLKVKKIL